MGLATASLHAYAPGLAAESAAGRLRALVCGSGGWVEDAAAEDRVIAVLESGACPWLSVYDTGLLEPDSSAAELSRALDRPVVAVVVEDSDRYSITLFASGKRVDRITAGVSRLKGSGHPEKWVSVLPHVSDVRRGSAAARRCGAGPALCADGRRCRGSRPGAIGGGAALLPPRGGGS